jgi:hypothetical protein
MVIDEGVNQGDPKLMLPLGPDTPAQPGSDVRAESTKFERAPLAKRMKVCVSSSMSLWCNFPNA